MSVLNIFFISMAVLLSLGCSQGVDSVQVTRREMKPSSYISTTDLQGAADVVPVSATYKMGIHSLGGNSLRTRSTSASFRMTSGIGVD